MGAWRSCFVMRIINAATPIPVLAGAILSACGSSGNEDRFFTADQMRGAIQGTWTGKLSGSLETLQLSVAYTPPSRSSLCGSRTVSHPLCESQTQSNIEVTVASSDQRFDRAVGIGLYTAVGLLAVQGGFSVTLSGDGPSPGITLGASIVQDRLEGSFFDGSTALESFVLVRAP